MVKKEVSSEGIKVLLVGNYANDGQESMRRFSHLLQRELPAVGVQAEHLSPKPVFGRFGGGMNQSGKWLGYMDKFLLFPAKLRRHIRALGPDSLVHVCDHSNAVYTPMLARIPHLVTCHDLLAVRSALGEFPGRRVRVAGRQFQRWILRGLNTSNRVACISRATRCDLLRLTSLAAHQTSVVHNGLNYSYGPLPEAVIHERLNKAAQRWGIPAFERKRTAGFILHVGGNQWYKNRLGVLQIYQRLCESMLQPPYLVMAGKAFTPELKQFIAAHHLEERVVELASVSNEELCALYCEARLLLFPSIEEGFGWPIAEAQACGCPVVIADREPMSEIGGEAAIYFTLEVAPSNGGIALTSKSVQDAANAVLRGLLESAGQRQGRATQGLSDVGRFSTKRMIEDYVHLYRRILKPVIEPRVSAVEAVSLQ